MTGAIYALCEPTTGEVRYVGKTTKKVEHRVDGHMRTARRGEVTHRACWIRKLMAAGCEPRIIVLEMVQAGNLDEIERHWIRVMRSRGCRLTNMTPGGEGGPTRTGRTTSLETRAKLSAAGRGKAHPWATGPRSPETKAKLSAAAKGRAVPWATGDRHYSRARVTTS